MRASQKTNFIPLPGSLHSCSAAIQRARQLRKAETREEKLLWRWLRDRRFSHYRGRIVLRLNETLYGWICQTVNRITGNVIGEILSPGERTQVRASVTTISILSGSCRFDSRKRLD